MLRLVKAIEPQLAKEGVRGDPEFLAVCIEDRIGFNLSKVNNIITVLPASDSDVAFIEDENDDPFAETPIYLTVDDAKALILALTVAIVDVESRGGTQILKPTEAE